MPPHAGFLQLSSPSDGILQPSPPTSPAHSHVEKNQLLPAFLDVFHAIKVASRILLTPAFVSIREPRSQHRSDRQVVLAILHVVPYVSASPCRPHLRTTDVVALGQKRAISQHSSLDKVAVSRTRAINHHIVKNMLTFRYGTHLFTCMSFYWTAYCVHWNIGSKNSSPEHVW
jgi:hypothetical protein